MPRSPVRAGLQVGAVTLAVVAFLVPLPAPAVERWYATGLYRVLQRAVTPLSDRVPFAVLDLLLVVAVLGVVAVCLRGVRRARRERRAGPLAGAAWRLVVAGAVAYLVFLGAWGLNYQRVPLAVRLDMREGAPGAEAVAALGREAATQLNALYAPAHAEGWGAPSATPTLRDGFAEIDRLLGARMPAVPARLKPSLLGAYFRWAGVDGMVNPFALETLANPDLLPFERPFVAAHEWAHLAGYADEAEASFVGWLACVRGGPAAAYSGWLALFGQVYAEAGREARGDLLVALDVGPREDLAAVGERQRRGRVVVVETAGRAVYDRYLRANRVDDGVRRYGAVVTLATQARFDDDWTPRLREDGG